MQSLAKMTYQSRSEKIAEVAKKWREADEAYRAAVVANPFARHDDLHDRRQSLRRELDRL